MPFGKNNDIISPLKFDLPDLRSTKQGRFSDYMDDIPKMAKTTEKIDGEVIWFEDEAKGQANNDSLLKKHGLTNFDNANSYTDSRLKMTFDSSNHTFKSGVQSINFDSYDSTVPIITSLQINGGISDSSKENIDEYVSNRKSASTSKKTHKIETKIKISSCETSHKIRESSKSKHTASHLTTRNRNFSDQDLCQSKSCSDFPLAENLKKTKSKEMKTLPIPNVTIRKSRRSSKEYLEKLDEEQPNFSLKALDELLIEHELRPNALPLKSPVKKTRVDQLILESGASPKKFDNSMSQNSIEYKDFAKKHGINITAGALSHDSNIIPEYRDFAKNLSYGSNITTESKNFATESKNFTPESKNFTPESKNFTTESKNFTTESKNFTTESKNFTTESKNFTTESKNFTHHLSEISNGTVENKSVAEQSGQDDCVFGNDAFADFLESVYDNSSGGKVATIPESDVEVGVQGGGDILSNTQKVHASLDQKISAAISFEFDSVRQLLYDQHLARVKLHYQGLDEMAAMHDKTEALCSVIVKLLDENELLRHVVRQLQKS